MKKLVLMIIPALICGIVLTSCSKVATKDGNVNVYFKATVLGQGLDCGNTFLIQFDKEVTDIPIGWWNNVYYADNLPEEYKIKEKRIEVQFRPLKDDEKYICTHMGPGYPHVYIVKVR